MKRRGRPRHPDVLTVREWEVLELLREDLSNEAIADRLAISAETVKSHVSSILRKPGESFVAHGAAVDNYPIFALSGGKVLTMSLQGDLTKEVVPAPDGSALVVGRTDNQYVVSNIPNGNGPTLATGATDLAFSPDG